MKESFLTQLKLMKLAKEKQFGMGDISLVTGDDLTPLHDTIIKLLSHIYSNFKHDAGYNDNLEEYQSFLSSILSENWDLEIIYFGSVQVYLFSDQRLDRL